MTTRHIRYLIASLTFFLVGAALHAVENHNSSRSNRGSGIVWPGPGSGGGAISLDTIKGIMGEIDRTPANQVTDKQVRDLLTKNGVSKMVAKIIVEPGVRGQVNIILLQDPKNEAAARKVMASFAIKEQGVK